MQVTYQKRDGSVIQKQRNTMLPYKIGETTSMGWKVINIEFEYNNKLYSEHDYGKIIQTNKRKYIRRKQTRELITKELKTILYYILIIMMYNLISILIRI